MHDMVVAGAGPVGSMLAFLCAKDMDVLVLEEDGRAGMKACSGLVSGRFMKMLPAKARKGDVIRHRVKAAVVHLFGRTFEMRRKECAFVIDRDRLDILMAESARERGADIRYGIRLTGVSGSGGSMRAQASGGTFGCSLLCGCDGARSAVARHIGARPAELLNGLIACEKRHAQEDCVEMWFDESCRDGFFWRIPRGDSIEYGGMGSGLSFRALDKFFGLSERKGLLRAAAPIPIGGVKRSCADGIMIAGDAAAQTKPWSGGGLAYGLIAAGCAAGVAKEALAKGDFSEGFLSAYERAWKGRLMADMEAGMLLREMLRDVNPAEISSAAGAIGALAGRAGGIDFDFPFSSLLSKAGGFSGR